MGMALRKIDNMNRIKFRIACFRARHSHWKGVKLRLKILRYCLWNINKIGIPVSGEEKETVKMVVSFYEKTVTELYSDINRVKKYCTEPDDDDFCSYGERKGDGNVE